jgi:hypothetical protein
MLIEETIIIPRDVPTRPVVIRRSHTGLKQHQRNACSIRQPIKLNMLSEEFKTNLI